MLKLLYITFGSEAEAVKVAHTLLTEKLISCANVLAGATSIYEFKGKIEQQSEAILFAKTTTQCAQQAAKRAGELHSYELPCILILPMESGTSEFADWVENFTKV